MRSPLCPSPLTRAAVAGASALAFALVFALGLALGGAALLACRTAAPPPAAMGRPPPAAPPPPQAAASLKSYTVDREGRILELDLVRGTWAPLPMAALPQERLMMVTSWGELDGQLLVCLESTLGHGYGRSLAVIDLETGLAPPWFHVDCHELATDGERVWLTDESFGSSQIVRTFVNGATLRAGGEANFSKLTKLRRAKVLAAAAGRLFVVDEREGGDQIVELDLATGEPHPLPIAPQDNVSGLAATRDQLFVANRGINVYDLATGQLVRTMFEDLMPGPLTQPQERR